MKRPVAVHPVLFAAFPVLALYSHNISYLSAVHIVKPLAVSISAAIVAVIFSSILLRNVRKAAMAVSFCIFWIFSYGHIYRAIIDPTGYFTAKHSLFGIGAQDLYFIFSCIEFMVILCVILISRSDLLHVTRVINVISVSLIAIVLSNVVIFKAMHAAPTGNKYEYGKAETAEPAKGSKPNIYYIILDGYARGDTLKRLYGHDNKDFTRFLKDKGFYVAEASVSNYCQTVLSFASSLNFEYLDSLAEKVGSDNEDRKWAAEMIGESRVFKFLKSQGYTTVSFDAAGSWNEIMVTGVDKLYRGGEASGISHLWEPNLSFFEKELINDTVIHVVIAKLRKLLYKDTDDEYEFYRKKMLYTFNKIEDLSKDKGPLFVFAHLLMPHQPFVFDENGRPMKPDPERFTIWCWDRGFRKNFKTNYIRQLKFANKRVRMMVDRIIANSEEPPIIIIQADHGPELMLDRESADKTDLKERMSILNAYYLPGDAARDLYPSISPVNTFRVIFDRYFGKDYPMVKDKSYFSTWSKPYRFIDVTEKVE